MELFYYRNKYAIYKFYIYIFFFVFHLFDIHYWALISAADDISLMRGRQVKALAEIGLRCIVYSDFTKGPHILDILCLYIYFCPIQDNSEVNSEVLILPACICHYLISWILIKLQLKTDTNW